MKVVSFEPSDVERIFRSFAGKRIAVIGDLMLDRYFWGAVRRISPEAPVPVVEVEEESTRLGGAANVANNIASLGATPILVGVCGTDTGGDALLRSVEQSGFSTEGIVRDNDRPTTVKTRVIAHGQHVVRIDRETKSDVTGAIAARMIAFLESHIGSIDGIILEDYNKGVLTADTIESIGSIASRGKRILTVDPKFNNFFAFKGATVFKPNRKETEEALGVRLQSEKDITDAGTRLMKRLECENVLLTLGEQGMALFEGKGGVTFVPTHARHVADVSGAGDTVIATLTVALSAGATVKEAAALANVAGGIVCGEVGIVPVNKETLRSAVLGDESA